MDGLILVTGATGYIASRLIPRLLERGARVRAMARDASRLDERAWSARVEAYSADVTRSATLPAALSGVHTAYYLIHNMTYGRGYLARELEGARAFASAAKQAGVEHIIYLGGLADPDAPIAPHLRSRIETGQVLRQSGIPVTEFRAGAIIGSGSISFEMIRFITELFPLLPGPRWLRNRSQPIAIDNVIDYLAGALDHPHSRIFEIGGPQVARYSDLMLVYAHLRCLNRRLLILPYLPLWFLAWFVGQVSPVPPRIAYALIGGLANDSVVKDASARELFPEINLIGYEQAVGEALAHLHPDRIEPVWRGRPGKWISLKHEGFFIAQAAERVNSNPEMVFHAITHKSGGFGWSFTLWIRRLHDRLSRIISSPQRADQDNYRAVRLRPMPDSGSGDPGMRTVLGERLDDFSDEARDPQRFLMRSKLVTPGEVWIEWRISPITGHAVQEGQQTQVGTRLVQTVYLAPRGLPGFLYWSLLYPFHWLLFHRLLRAIRRKTN